MAAALSRNDFAGERVFELFQMTRLHYPLWLHTNVAIYSTLKDFAQGMETRFWCF